MSRRQDDLDISPPPRKLGLFCLPDGISPSINLVLIGVIEAMVCILHLDMGR